LNPDQKTLVEMFYTFTGIGIISVAFFLFLIFFLTNSDCRAEGLEPRAADAELPA